MKECGVGGDEDQSEGTEDCALIPLYPVYSDFEHYFQRSVSLIIVPDSQFCSQTEDRALL